MLHDTEPTVILITPRDFLSNYKQAECMQNTATVLCFFHSQAIVKHSILYSEPRKPKDSKIFLRNAMNFPFCCFLSV